MMKIDTVASQPDRVGRYTVRFQSGATMRLYRQTVQDFGLYSGKEMTESEYAELIQEASKMSAKMRAIRIVSASNVSKGDLQQRLIQKGEDAEHARQAVAWMSDMDLLDDGKTAQQIVSRCIAKGYGVNRAKQALYEKRIPKSYWDEILEGYPGQEDVIVDFLRSRLTDTYDRKQLQKTIDALIRKGHNYSTIRKCIRLLSFNEEFLEE